MPFANVLKDILAIHLFGAIQDLSNQLLKNLLILAHLHHADLILTVEYKTEILPDVLARLATLEYHLIADLNALVIRIVQVIWLVFKKNVKILVQELAHLQLDAK